MSVCAFDVYPLKLFLVLLPCYDVCLLFSFLQINKRGRVQFRALLVSDSHIFKLDPLKGYQRKKVPVPLQDIIGIGLSPGIDQGFVIYLKGGSDLVCYMLVPGSENRVTELVALLCQICQR